VKPHDRGWRLPAERTELAVTAGTRRMLSDRGALSRVVLNRPQGRVFRSSPDQLQTERDSLPDDAVSSEPVSLGSNSLISREITRNFIDFGLFRIVRRSQKPLFA
jgi:hypothetical protein